MPLYTFWTDLGDNYGRPGGGYPEGAESGAEEGEAFHSDGGASSPLLGPRSGSLQRYSMDEDAAIMQQGFGRDSSAPLASSEGRRRLLKKASEQMRSGMAGWQAKLLQRQGSLGNVYNGQTVCPRGGEGGAFVASL